jgi:hypothetical protein
MNPPLMAKIHWNKGGAKIWNVQEYAEKIESMLRSFHRKFIKQVAVQARTNPKKKFGSLSIGQPLIKMIYWNMLLKKGNAMSFTSGPSERSEVLAKHFAGVFINENDNRDVFDFILPKTCRQWTYNWTDCICIRRSIQGIKYLVFPLDLMLFMPGY